MSINEKLITKLQAIDLDDEFIFSQGLSGLPLTKPIVLNDLIIRKHSRTMGYAGGENLPFESFDRINAVDFYAYKTTYTTLGVLLFDLLFQNETNWIEIQLPQANSEIKQFYIYLDRENTHPTHELQILQKETYSHFRYFSQEVDKYPLTSFTKRGFIANALPHFGLGCSNHHDSFSKDWLEKANQVALTLTVTSLIQMAELFLDIGRNENNQTEICLENPLFGCGGVNQRSIEARFWLPNSFGFYAENIEDLKF